LPKKTLADLQSDAVVLAGKLRGIDLMQNEGKMFDGARISITTAALERAEKLADDLDGVKA